MDIVALTAEDHARVAQVAALVLDGFSDTGATAWPTFEAALTEVHASFEAGRLSRVALDATGAVGDDRAM